MVIVVDLSFVDLWLTNEHGLALAQLSGYTVLGPVDRPVRCWRLPYEVTDRAANHSSGVIVRAVKRRCGYGIRAVAGIFVIAVSDPPCDVEVREVENRNFVVARAVAKRVVRKDVHLDQTFVGGAPPGGIVENA